MKHQENKKGITVQSYSKFPVKMVLFLKQKHTHVDNLDKHYEKICVPQQQNFIDN